MAKAEIYNNGILAGYLEKKVQMNIALHIPKPILQTLPFHQ